MTSTQLERRLRRATGRDLRLSLTNNRHRVLSYQPARAGQAELRLSRIFLNADAHILQAIASFIRGSRRAKHTLQKFADKAVERQARRRARRGIPVQPLGDVYNLHDIFDRLNYMYFAGSVEAYITWGRKRHLPGKKTVQLGAYSEAERLIRINPVLDQPQIPLHVIEKVVFHEMLHHVLAPGMGLGRRCVHTREFYDFEQRFPRYAQAEHWLRRNINFVLA